MSLMLHYTVASDRGLVRTNNEDSAYAGPHLLVLADGMGGHAAGEVASALMVEHLEHLDADDVDGDVLQLLRDGAATANESIAETIRQRPETDGMGTTLTAAKFTGKDFGLIHVGDSRGYRLRDGKLEQLTVDDTYVQSLVNEGALDPADVSTHPKKSLILKAYTGAPVEAEVTRIDAVAGDRILLCSDGLSDPVTASTIEQALGEGSPEVAAARLVELALRSGGPDNVTVVVADVLDREQLDEKALSAIPHKPLVGGALAGDAESATHPNTSAGRAAALRKTQAVPGASQREPEASQSSLAEDVDEEPSPRTGRWIGLIIILGLVLALIGAGWWASSRIADTFYLDTNDNDEFVIEQGVNFSVFGRDLHSPVQQACISDEGSLRFVDIGEEADCTLFSLDDLPQNARGSVDALGSGSYDEVTSQLRRLAEEALPVCLTTEDENRAQTSNLTQPGVNCREVQ